MAKQEHLEVLRRGAEAWDAWQRQNPAIEADLSGADLAGAKLSGSNLFAANLAGTVLSKAELDYAYLSGANLSSANLAGTRLVNADLRNTNLHKANLAGALLSLADLSEANLAGANLAGANLFRANLSWANLAEARLIGANLERALLVRTNLNRANLTGCRVYGISAWDLKLDDAEQNDLVITSLPPSITVDNLEVAQFIYLLLDNKRIRDVIDTITSKVVLILGRFTDDRKVVLDALREELRQRDYLPVLFDFDKPTNRSTVETVETLAHMARFVVADLTDAKSVLQELQAVVPSNPSVPVQMLILSTQEEPGMLDFILKFSWVLPCYRYTDLSGLLGALTNDVIRPAEAKVVELKMQR